MIFSLVLALMVVGLTMSATAQKQHQKPKASYNEEKQSSKGARAVKEPGVRTSSAQELRRVEQSSARASATHKAPSGKTAHAPVLKGQKGDANPPIHFASASPGKGSKGKTADPLKGRLRHKGSRQ
jgi:hypothetical protein